MDSLPPQFIEIVEAVRDVYVRQYSEFVGGLSEDTHIVEPVLLDAEGAFAVEGPLNLPHRADFALLETGELAMFTAEKSVVFEAFSFPLGATQIVISPFHWDSALVRVTGKWDEHSSRLFEEWYRSAFGDDDATYNLAIRNVVHFVSDPEISQSGYTFTADLGTAPASTLGDLLLALLGNTPESIEVGT